MAVIRPTVLDVSRAVVDLDATPTDRALWSLVASGLAFHWSRTVYPCGGRKNVTKRDVVYALASHGASAFTIEQSARGIAAIIRADFADGNRFA
jgi:hypothetical protein